MQDEAMDIFDKLKEYENDVLSINEQLKDSCLMLKKLFNIDCNYYNQRLDMINRFKKNIKGINVNIFKFKTFWQGRKILLRKNYNT